MKKRIAFAVLAMMGAGMAEGLPVAAEADVVVVGGSAAGVAAAVAAKEAGAEVYVVAPRPYFGEELAGKLRLAKEVDDERSLCLRELCLARALYRLGDVDGLGRRTLEAYAADPRRAYANHARKVLESR